MRVGVRDCPEAGLCLVESEAKAAAERDELIELVGGGLVEGCDEMARVDERCPFGKSMNQGAPMDVIEESEKLVRGAKCYRLVEGWIAREQQRLGLQQPGLQQPERARRDEQVLVRVFGDQGERRAKAGRPAVQHELQGEGTMLAAKGENADRHHGMSAGELADGGGEHGAGLVA